MDKVSLRVAESLQEDVNKGIIRVSLDIIKELDLNPGDAVGIKGERETVATIEKAYPADFGLDIARIDGTIRKNAKIGMGEQIEIFKIELERATKVVLVPITDFVPHPNVLANLKKGLYKKPLSEGDIISVTNNQKKRQISSSNPFALELFNSIEQDFLGFNLNLAKFKVRTSKPNGFLFIDSTTEIVITNSPDKEEETLGISYEDIGGLKSQLLKIRELVELPLKHPEIFLRLGINAPKGILLYGPPGTGKTLLAKAIASESEATFYSISAPEIVNKYYGESEKKLRELFKKAESTSPSIIFIDEIDAIATKREEVQGDTEKRIVAQLLTLMDGITKNKNVVVIAATNRPDTLDEALRRPGRFDRELEIAVPKEEERLEILKIHIRGMPIALPKEFKKYMLTLNQFIEKHKKEENKDKKDEELIDVKEIRKDFREEKFFEALSKLPKEVVEKVKYREELRILRKISKVTHGFVGADLEALVKEAAFSVLRRTFPDLDLKEEKEIPQEVLNKLEIREDDFMEALKVVRPSAMREFLVEVPDVKWEDIGGLEDIKGNLAEMIEWPLKNPEAFQRLGIKSPKGILLYGPPGTGKTLLAKAVATETKSNFLYIKGPEIVSKYVGESEKTIRKLFEKARQNSPSILFFDEFDSIAGERNNNDNNKTTNSIVNQILTEMDGLEDLINVKVIAATNRPQLIDPALLRPGRFDKLILVDVPDEKARESIFKINLKETPMQNKQKQIKELASKTDGYVGADIEALVREAGLIALRRDIKAQEVLEEDFKKALDVIKPTVSPQVRKLYAEIENEMKNPQKETKEIEMSGYL